MRDRCDQHRNHQSRKLINIESGPAAGFCDGMEQTRTGDDEKKRHHPTGSKNIPYLYPYISINILNVPVAQIKESGAVIKKNDQNGQYAKPV